MQETVRTNEDCAVSVGNVSRWPTIETSVYGAMLPPTPSRAGLVRLY